MVKEVFSSPQLNLARKWRSKNFDEIIGQELSVRMLKNSLYSGQLFPVYLFSGQRGCGKTSTARVFAAAVNCEQLPFFRQNPKHIMVPCAVCASCTAMAEGKHPDCIEVDAASHTGVDNIRTIVDAASFLPLLGNKKIYLIDEAHMLSKAAFNAFLKILEEPPASVLFILATTDPEKIIETVKSRCFQVIFKPINKQPLVAHLEAICTAENIAYEPDALVLIAQESEGAARDALNLLEQVRFAHSCVTKEAVFAVLGRVSDAQLHELFCALLTLPLPEFAAEYARIVTDQMSPSFLWKASIGFFRTALGIVHAIPSEDTARISEDAQGAIKKHTAKKFIGLMRLFYEHELMFLKTSTPHVFLQMIFFRACHVVQGEELSPVQGSSSSIPSSGKVRPETSVKKVEITPVIVQEKRDLNGPDAAAWSSFLHSLDVLGEPLVASVLKQGHFVRYDAASGQLFTKFPQTFTMFEDMVMAAKVQWQPLLNKAFGCSVSLLIGYQAEKAGSPMPVALDVKKKEMPKLEVPVARASSSATFPEKKMYQKKGPVKKDIIVDVSDKETWKKTHVVLEFFPGVVTELQGEEDVSV